MKITIHIFTIYIFALSLVPCGDGGGGIVEIAQHLLEIAPEHPTDHEQHSRDCTDDACTVFCICSCCSIALDVPVDLPLSIHPPASIQTQAVDHYQSPLHADFTSRLLQPPALS